MISFEIIQRGDENVQEETTEDRESRPALKDDGGDPEGDRYQSFERKPKVSTHYV